MLKALDSEGQKRIEVEILDSVAEFCDKNGINYFLHYGTLIGAIRHKGFIPWDDDIDIGMLRPDYDKFVRLFNAANKRYQLHCFEIEPDFPRPFCKVYDTKTLLIDNGWKSCINIDVWVADNAPDDENALRDMFRRQLIYRRLYLFQFLPFRIPKGNIFRKILGIGARIFIKMMPSFILPKNYFARKVIENSRRYISEQTRRVGMFVGAQNAAVDRSGIEKTIYVDFEGRKYKAPSCYDGLLRQIYGDYMQLPPEEERITGHKFEAYIEDNE